VAGSERKRKFLSRPARHPVVIGFNFRPADNNPAWCTVATRPNVAERNSLEGGAITRAHGRLKLTEIRNDNK